MKLIEDMRCRIDVNVTVLPEFGNAYTVIVPVEGDEDIKSQIEEFVDENLANVQDYEAKTDHISDKYGVFDTIAFGAVLGDKKLDLPNGSDDILVVLESAYRDYCAPWITSEYRDAHEEFQYFRSWCENFLTQEYIDRVLNSN